MASFVTEVLSSAGRLERQEVQSKLEILTKKVDDLKLQVHNVTTNNYVDFYPNLATSRDLRDNLDQVSTEMQEVADKIENEIKNQLNMSTGEFQALSTQLKEVKEILVALEKLVQLQENLECISNADKANNFSQAAEALLGIQTLLGRYQGDYSDVKILVALQTEYQVQKQKFLYNLDEKWKDMMVWNLTEKKCELKLMITDENESVLVAIIEAFNKLDILDTKMKNFGDKLMKHILRPCVMNSVSVDVILSHAPTIVTSSLQKDEVVPLEPTKLFSALGQILYTLNNKLLHLCVRRSKEGPAITLMEKLGSVISRELLDLVVKECLIPAIPSNNKELEGFSSVLSATKEFHLKLEEVKFIDESNTILDDFKQNVNILFANKKCQHILERARLLLTTEIHNTVQVCEDKPLGELPPLEPQGGPSEKKSRRIEPECRLDSNTFRLPDCHVSACVQKLLCLAYDTLGEATESSPQCAVQMFFAVRNMFELYCFVFPTFHKKNLEMLPQMSAIFHNNSMFIAHHLMTLGHQFSKKLPANVNSTFVDLVPKIRSLGAEHFLQQLSRQKNQMTEYLKGAHGFANLSAEESHYFDAERALKQVLHQFLHLQKVWQDVLPPNIYKKAIGTLLKSVLTDIVSDIVALEDISSDDARKLASLLLILQNKAGLLLTTEADDEAIVTVELQKNVPKWLRFKELITVLNASLLEISDRWADGKGPLAMVFTANEVKQLIRALFQNTDRRSAILAKIR